jgi:hypothetical protein
MGVNMVHTLDLSNSELREFGRTTRESGDGYDEGDVRSTYGG